MMGLLRLAPAPAAVRKALWPGCHSSLRLPAKFSNADAVVSLGGLP